MNIELLNKANKEVTELKAIVERYRKLVCQTCDGHGMVGNILDSMDCPDCLAIENLIKWKGAKGFKGEMLAASNSMLHPHIEGVFAVYEIKLREQK